MRGRSEHRNTQPGHPIPIGRRGPRARPNIIGLLFGRSTPGPDGIAGVVCHVARAVTATVVTLLLVAALAHASWNAMLKGRRGEPLAASAGLCLTWVVGGLPFAAFVEPPAPAAYPFLAASVGLHVVYFALLVAAYRHGDLSVVYPIARGIPPLLVAVGGWVVAGEGASWVSGLGIGLVTVGVLGLGLRRAPADKSESAQPSRRSVGLALATALLIAGYTVVDGLGVRASGHAAGYVVWLMTAHGAVFGLSALAIGGRALRAEVWARRQVAVVAGVLSAGGYAVALWAMTHAPLAYVAALRETSVVFAALIGARFLGEPLGRVRLIAAAVVASGVVAIELGTL